MTKNKIVQAATMKLEVELRCSECNSPLIVNNTWSDVHGLSCYVEPCEECMSRRTQRAADFACTCEKFEDFTALTDPACPVHGRASQSR